MNQIPTSHLEVGPLAVSWGWSSESIIAVPENQSGSLMRQGVFSERTSVLVRHVVEVALKGWYSSEIEQAWADVLWTATPNDLDVLAHSEVILFVKEQIYKHPLAWKSTKLHLLATCESQVTISGKKRRGGGNDEWLFQVAHWTSDCDEIAALIQNPTTYVRENVARNEHLPKEYERVLARDSSSRVREVIAQRTNEFDILFELLSDSDEKVWLTAGWRSSMPTATLEKCLIERGFPPRGFPLLLKRLDIQASTLNRVARDIRKLSPDDPCRMTAVPLLTMHPSTSGKIRREFWWEAKEQVFGYDHHVPF